MCLLHLLAYLSTEPCTIIKPCICQSVYEYESSKHSRVALIQVSVPDAQLEQLDALEGSWAGFRSCLDETAASLERAKDSFRDKLVHMVDSFATDVVVSRDVFVQDAPYSHEVSICSLSACLCYKRCISCPTCEMTCQL